MLKNGHENEECADSSLNEYRKTKFDQWNEKEHAKINDKKHKEMMRENVMRQRRKQRKLDKERRAKQEREKRILHAWKQDKRQIYDKYLKKNSDDISLTRNHSKRNYKLTPKVDLEKDSYAVRKVKSKKFTYNEYMEDNDSFKSHENHVKMNFELSQEKRKEQSSFDREFDKILENNIEDKKENKESSILDRNSTKLIGTNESKFKRNVLGNVNESRKTSKRVSSVNVNNGYADRYKEKHAYDGPSHINKKDRHRNENEVMESIAKLDVLIKNKMKNIKATQKRPKSVFSAQNIGKRIGYNNSITSTNKTPLYYTNYKNQNSYNQSRYDHDILSNFQNVIQPPVFSNNMYSQVGMMNPYQMPPVMYNDSRPIQTHINNLPNLNENNFRTNNTHGGYNESTTDNYELKRKEDVSFPSQSNAKEETIQELSAIGKIPTDNKENSNLENIRKLKPISIINETNSYSVLTDVALPKPNKYNGEISYLQRRNMKKMRNKNGKSKVLEEIYEDDFLVKKHNDVKIQYQPNKLKELFED